LPIARIKGVVPMWSASEGSPPNLRAKNAKIPSLIAAPAFYLPGLYFITAPLAPFQKNNALVLIDPIAGRRRAGQAKRTQKNSPNEKPAAERRTARRP